MAEAIRWGILGTGNISKKFAEGLGELRDAELVAVGSRRLETAKAFASSFKWARAHGSYEELANDPEVQVVYIGTVNNLHMENAIMCMEAGKAVLCEKPFTINAKQARKVIETARAKKIFLMEAMWTRFLPIVVKFREMVGEGAIGTPRTLFADFGFAGKGEPGGRLLNPELGGGSLLDVGIYCVSFSSMVFGPPTRITSVAKLTDTGVDEDFACILEGKGGTRSVLASSIGTRTAMEATLAGTEGFLRIHTPFWRSNRMTLSRQGKKDEAFELAFKGNGYCHEAAHVMECMRAGKTESEVMGLDETLGIMGTMDEARGQCGIRFPME